MSDNRRRRKSHNSGSEELSDSYDELNTTKETQSTEPNEEHHDSEYDTAGSESDGESQDRTQRESGDGQEEEKAPKKLDDDEDRRNPQYIPKRGTFYEHDDRTADEVNDEAVETVVEREVKDKKVWKEKEDKWNHDRYNDEEQAPKSHAELIAIYGYDIRNEEGPPRARRRRRYGRGPNKYTRNWEDEDAYGKVAGTVPMNKPTTRKGNHSGEEFPSLTKDSDIDSVIPQDQPVITSAWYSNKNKTPTTNKTQNFPPLNQTESQKARSKQYANSQTMENKSPNERNTSWKRDSKNTSHIQNANETDTTNSETEKIVIVKTTPRENRKPTQVQESLNLGPTKSRGRGFKANTNNNTVVGNRVMESKPKGRGPMNIDNRRSNVEHEQIVEDMKHMNVSTDGPSYHHPQRQNKQFYSHPSGQQHSAIVPQRMHQNHPQQQSGPPSQQPQQQQPSQPSTQQQQDIATNRPKRYSSLRQRPAMAEGPPPPPQPNYQPAPPQHPYYPPPQAGSSRAVLDTPGYPPGPYEQPAPVPAPAAPLAAPPVMPMPPPGAPATTYAPPPPYLVPPPQFIPPQTAPPNIINYVPGPNGPIFQPNYQGFTPPGPPPPQEVGLFQPQGCTYYSPAQQQQQQQQLPVPLRRPKAAIPILPPPDNLQNRMRDRNIQQTPEQQQLQQQQQHQEQLVQQQLQQHHQQLIQEQQQELQQQQERKQQLERQQQEQQLKQQHEQMLREQQQKQQQEQLLREQQQKQQQEQLLKEQILREQQKKEQSGIEKQEEQQQQKEQEEQPEIEKQQQKEHIEQPESEKLEEKQQLEIEKQDEQEQQKEQKEQLENEKQQEQPQQKEEKEQLENEKQQEQKEQLENEKQQEQQQQKEEKEQRENEKQPEQKEQVESEKQQEQQQQKEQPENEKQQEEIIVEEQSQKTVQETPEVEQRQEQSDESRELVTSTVVDQTGMESVSTAKVIENIDSAPEVDTKVNLDEKFESIQPSTKPETICENKIEPIVVENEVEKKEVTLKVEVIVPVGADVIEEKLQSITEVITKVPDTSSATEVINKIPELSSGIETSSSITNDGTKDISTKTVELVSVQNDTETSIKEAAVIEETAA